MLLSVLETPEKRRSDQIIHLLFDEGTAEIFYVPLSHKSFSIELKEKILKVERYVTNFSKF